MTTYKKSSKRHKKKTRKNLGGADNPPRTPDNNDNEFVLGVGQGVGSEDERVTPLSETTDDSTNTGVFSLPSTPERYQGLNRTRLFPASPPSTPPRGPTGDMPLPQPPSTPPRGQTGVMPPSAPPSTPPSAPPSTPPSATSSTPPLQTTRRDRSISPPAINRPSRRSINISPNSPVNPIPFINGINSPARPRPTTVRRDYDEQLKQKIMAGNSTGAIRLIRSGHIRDFNRHFNVAVNNPPEAKGNINTTYLCLALRFNLPGVAMELLKQRGIDTLRHERGVDYPVTIAATATSPEIVVRPGNHLYAVTPFELATEKNMVSVKNKLFNMCMDIITIGYNVQEPGLLPDMPLNIADRTGYDIIEGEEVNTAEWIGRDDKNFVICDESMNNIFLHNYDDFKFSLINQSNIKYGCKTKYFAVTDGRTQNITEEEATSRNMSGVTIDYTYDISGMNMPYFVLRGFGLFGVAPYNQVIAMAKQIKFSGTHGMPIRKQFVAVKTDRRLSSTFSLSTVTNGSMVGASHCQEGQEADVYELRAINVPRPKTPRVKTVHTGPLRRSTRKKTSSK